MLRITAFMMAVLMSFSASAHDNQSELISIKTVEVNGEKIQLSMTAGSDGMICAQYIESIQFIAYGENAYNIGKKCTRIPPKTERT